MANTTFLLLFVASLCLLGDAYPFDGQQRGVVEKCYGQTKGWLNKVVRETTGKVLDNPNLTEEQRKCLNLKADSAILSGVAKLNDLRGNLVANRQPVQTNEEFEQYRKDVCDQFKNALQQHLSSQLSDVYKCVNN